ncbi:aminopeptidase N-like [Rhipicephalus microplus]|uniref:aminopeptidase N-like n=1 Tax=Rhipicephalus microplus TaxID=6941 RepID=UPI003F6A6FDB
MASSVRRAAVESSDSGSKRFRSTDSDSAQTLVVKHQPWQLICLASCFVISVVVTMGFGAASVSGSPHRSLSTSAVPRRSVGRARGALTWWYFRTNSHSGLATATTTNTTVGNVLPRLLSGDEETSDQESSIGSLRNMKRADNAHLLLPPDSANAGVQQGAKVSEKNTTDATSAETTGLPSTPTVRGTRRVELEGSTPIHYVLEIEPSMDEATNFSFNGTVTLTFVCRKRTDRIALHAAPGLAVDVLNIVATFRSVQKPLRVENTSRNVIEDLYHIRLREQLHRNERYNLTLRFSGTVGTEPKGLYRVGYVDVPGKRHKWALLTNMRPKYARRVFPCFDDPSVTASFDIVVVHRKEVNVLSNMPVYRTERRTPDLVADTFARTPRIPTLLIALTLNDFPSFGKGTMRVWTRASATALAQKLALDVVPKLLEHYEDYYETKYPMPKLDIVILSNCSIDTSGYFGLIFMKEPTFILQNPRKTMAKDALHRLSALAYAISAQWFGNHVTLSGWNNIWLSRALAGFNKYSALKKIDSYWDSVSNQFYPTQQV